MEQLRVTSGVVGGRNRGRAVAGVCAFLVLGIGYAKASTLNPAVVSGSVFFNFSPPPGINFSTFGTFSQTGPGGFVQATASGTPSPFLSGEATVSTGFTGRASGILIYEIEVVGPAGVVDVPVTVSGGAAGSSSAVDPFAGFALKALW